MNFFMAMIPPTVTAQMKRVTVSKNGKPIFYEDQRLADARDKLTAHRAQHIPGKKMKGPIRLITKWCFPKIKGKSDGQYKDTKPDTDNLQKLLKDCMTTVGFWKDDAQVVSEIVEKFWADIPGIYIEVEEI